MNKKIFNECLDEAFSIKEKTINIKTDSRIEGKGFLYDLALFYAIKHLIDDPKLCNEKRVIEEMGWNTLFDFLNTMEKYHSGSKAGEVVSIYAVINKPLLFKEIDDLHKVYIEEFPLSFVTTMYSSPYIPNLLEGSYYFPDALDDVERLTLFNAMIRRWSKGECVDSLYFVPGMKPTNLEKIIELSNSYILNGLSENVDGFVDYFAQSGVTIDLAKHFNEYCKRVPLEDSHIRAKFIKDKCAEIIKEN